MATAKTARIPFRVTGEFITNFARDLVLEGKWDRALRNLMDTLHGMTYDFAIKILSGESRLIGVNNDIELVDELQEEAAKYQKKVAWLYAGTIRLTDDICFRPYAWVSNWGPADMHSAGSLQNSHRGAWNGYLKEVYPWRSIFYADSRKNDVLMYLNLPYDGGRPGASVLWKKAPNVPPWFPIRQGTSPNEAQKALNEWLEHHKLEERGHHQMFGDDPSLWDRPRYEHPLERKTKAQRETEEAEQEEAFKAQCAWIKEKVTEQAKANGGFFTLAVQRPEGDPRPLEYIIPRLPFVKWALRGEAVHSVSLGNEWASVSPQGLKMAADSPIHTDWVVGAGIPFDSLYGQNRDEPLDKAAWEEAHRITAQLTNHDVVILAGQGMKSVIEGRIIHPKPGDAVLDGQIAVIPTASPEYAKAVMTAAAVVAETGGALCHLATVTRESNGFLLLLPGAIKKLPEKTEVRINAKMNRLIIL